MRGNRLVWIEEMMDGRGKGVRHHKTSVIGVRGRSRVVRAVGMGEQTGEGASRLAPAHKL